ncbi:hypothetical protein JXJ21_20170 [candidate division KSB1 bacterium]|nr:hypothetical protein [candidate division KSB1 bacterium]
MKIIYTCRKIALSVVICLRVFTAPAFSQQSTKIHWDKIAFPVITIEDSVLMEKLADELLVLIDSTTTDFALVDLNFDGFGLNDILIVHPSNEIYFLDKVTKNAAEMLRGRPPYDIHSMVLANGAAVAELKSTELDYVPIVKVLHQIVEKIYGSIPLRIFYGQDESGIQFELLKLENKQQNSDEVKPDTMSSPEK